jgi:nucleotide-binding universal stress UspA family protein
MLVAVDASPSGQFVLRLAGLLAGSRQIATTVIHFDYASRDEPPEGERQAARVRAAIKENVAEGDQAGRQEGGSVAAAITTRVEDPDGAPIAAEAEKGYGFLVIGREPASEGPDFHEQITASVAEFSGPFAIVIARGADRSETTRAPLNILVPVSGTATARHGAEFAIALAQAARGSVTALHFISRSQAASAARSWQREVGAAIAPMGSADAVVREIVRLGDPYGVTVTPAVQSAGTSVEAILRQIHAGRHNLVVLGVNIRPGEQLDLGRTASALLDQAQCSLMFVISEQPTALGDQPAESTG